MYGFVSLLSVAVTYIKFLLLFPILKPLLVELFLLPFNFFCC